MAQNFRRYTENNVGTSAVDIPDGSNFDSYDAIVGISLANVDHQQSMLIVILMIDQTIFI